MKILLVTLKNKESQGFTSLTLAKRSLRTSYPNDVVEFNSDYTASIKGKVVATMTVIEIYTDYTL